MASNSEDISPVSAMMSIPPLMEPLLPTDPSDSEKPAPFEYIAENICLTERQTNRERKKAKRMVCECLLDEEDPSNACGADCLNRLLMMECGSRCPCGEFCTNKRFQKCQYIKTEVYKTEFKGWGLRALEDTPADSFMMEYCGEVCTTEEFMRRKKEYHKERRRHYYFMSLKSDEILDATRKGNMSRFINHSCDPNCETQKWTVNGLLRIGFFSVRDVKAGEELTFDYKFQRFGEEAQKCYCGSDNCRGILGGPPPKDSRRAGEFGVRRERRRREGVIIDTLDEVERSVYDLIGNKGRLVSQEQALPLSRAMIQAELPQHRLLFLSVLQQTENAACLKKFVAFQGLPLLWSWMVESSDLPASQQNEMRMQLLKTLSHLPITTKNQIEDNKILTVVQKWAVTEEDPETKQESVDHTPIVSPYSPDATGNTTPSRSNEMEGTSQLQAGEEEIGDPSEDAQLPMDSNLAPHGVQLQTGSGEGWDGHSQVHVTEGQGTTDHGGVPDETPQEAAQDAHKLTDETLPGAAGGLSGEGAPHGLRGSPSEGPMEDPRPLPTEEAPTDAEAQDLHPSVSDPGGTPESLQVVSDEESTALNCTRTGEDSPTIAALDVRSTDATGLEGSCDAENTLLASPEVAKEEDDVGPTASAQLSPVYSDTEQVALPLQQDPPTNPVSCMEVVSMATQLLDRWQDLKEVFRIPKKKPNPSGHQEEQAPAAASVVDRTAEKVDRVRKETEVQQQKAATFWPSPLEHMRKRRDRPIRSEWRDKKDKIPRTFSPHAFAETSSALKLMPLSQNNPLVAPGNQLPIHQVEEVRLPSLFDVPSFSLVQQPPPSVLTMGMAMAAQPTQNVASLLPTSLQQQLASLLPHPAAFAAQQMAYPVQQTAPRPQSQESAAGGTQKSQDMDEGGQLPENWKVAYDASGNAYYYHVLTRKSQWERPTAMEEMEDNPIEMVEMDMVTPSPITPNNETMDTSPQTSDPVGMPRTPEGSPPTTEEEESAQFVTSTTGQSSTKELFRNQTSKVVLQCLNKHRKPDCKFGRILNTQDFKHLARKITHAIMEKEAAHKGGYEQLQFGPSTQHKTKKYIKEYMKKCGPVYKRA